MNSEAQYPPEDIVEARMRGRILKVPEFSEADVRKAVKRHLEIMAGGVGGQIIKRAAKTNVTLFEWNDASGRKRLCVKEFIRSGMRGWLPNRVRHLPAYRSWTAARLLDEKNIGAPPTLAVLIGRKERSYLIMQEIEDAQHLLSYTRNSIGRTMPLSQRRAFMDAGATFLSRCYRGGVCHGDLKATNLFVRENRDGTWIFTLLDLAAVRVPAKPRRGDKLLNLAQLNASTPRDVTRTDRLRFLRKIAESDATLGGHETIDEILRLTRRRGGVWLQ